MTSKARDLSKFPNEIDDVNISGGTIDGVTLAADTTFPTAPSGMQSTVFMGPGDGNDYKSGATFTNFVTFPYDVTIEAIDYQYLQSNIDNNLEAFGFIVGAGSFVALDIFTGTAAGTRAATKDVSIAVSAGTRFHVGPNTSSNNNQSRIVVSIHYKVN